MIGKITSRAFSTLLLTAHTLGAQTDAVLGSLSDYPVADKIWLTSVVGDITVNPEFPVEASNPGELEWLIGDGEKVEMDQALCYTDITKIKLSERDLALKKSRHTNALHDIESSYTEKRKTVESAIEEIGLKLSDLDLTPTERELLGADFEIRIQEQKRKLKEEIERLNFKLESEYFALGQENERNALNLEIDNTEQVHRELLNSNVVRADHAGTLSQKKTEIIRPDTVIGTITKTGVAEALVEVADPKLRNVPPARLSLEIRGDDGITYQGKYLRTLEAKSFQRNDPVYVFGIRSPKEDGSVPESLNGRRLFRVSRILDAPGHIVPKGDLLFKFPDEINSKGWVAFIDKRWNGVSILYIGPKDLVIAKDDEN